MCKVLLPIRPVFAYQILNGKKKYEYRKNRFKRHNVDCIVIYATSPIKKVIGEVKLLKVLEDTPHNIWESTNDCGGIDKKDYDMYFQNKDTAIAYGLGTVKKYEKELSELDINYYPQSYVYLEEDTKKKQQKP